MITEIFYYLVQVILAYLVADLVMGIYHWIKDTYFSPFTPVIGRTLIWGSRLHHVRPRYVIEFSNFELFWSSAKWTLIWFLPLIYFTGLSVFMITLYLIIALNDVVHKYAHMFDNERPLWATFMQYLYIFQSHDEHHLHHISPHDINYCPITPFMNYFLEKINFWRKMENIIEHYFNIKPREKEDEFVEDINYPAGIKFIQN
ncbi:MAG: putative transmembrane protein [Satyrvirus sp.]|uniref:Putative transmembrane protein n=1 Tax=Satyrvirus sp. TaxID=2487771 RepID=A0A3G5ACS8_9VIRU|nr:MAG: putative transmembrane protein [Satyrvirus sp.]